MGNRPLDPILWGKIMGGGGGSGSVTSVNGQTGAVVLTATDVGAEPEKFVVNVEQVSPTVYVADKSIDELLSAYQSGKLIELYYDNSILRLSIININNSVLGFSSLLFADNPNGDEYHLYQFVAYKSGGTDTWISLECSFNPGVTNINKYGADVYIEPAANTIYKCGELTSLTISNPPATGAYSIVFTSGSTATTTTIPATILGLEDFAAEANTLYEINVLDNRAVVGSWAVSA